MLYFCYQDFSELKLHVKGLNYDVNTVNESVLCRLQQGACGGRGRGGEGYVARPTVERRRVQRVHTLLRQGFRVRLRTGHRPPLRQIRRGLLSPCPRCHGTSQ